MATLQSIHPFETLYQQVAMSKEQALNGDTSWFLKNSLRHTMYQKLLDETLVLMPRTTEVIAQMVENMWTICTETALLVLTQIAPQESYKDHERAILAITIGPSHMISTFSAVQRSIEHFQQTLNQPLEKDHKVALICNLYRGIHSFVVEKRADDTCIIYQSYEQGYTFDEFLKDSSKHIQWKSEKLGQIFAKTVSKDMPIQKRIKNYRKLFFREPTEKDFKKYDQSYSCPMLFVTTTSYK